MAELPHARVAAYESPFSYTGVDYLGPISVIERRSSVKRWIVLFTCLTTRAIHVELAYSLDTDHCIMCIRSFMLTRGYPLHMFSDQGTNFIASEKLLREEVEKIDNEAVHRYFEHETLKWTFNPPGAPSMGGAWERMVRSFKNAFYAAPPTRKLTDAVLRACMAEAVYILNSRPLTYLPLDSSESEALTPNHFMLGSSNGRVKHTTRVPPEDKLARDGYLTAQQFRDRMWKRWVNEYLPDLVRRTKNFEPVTPLAVGDIAIICDPTLQANVWLKGQIVETFPGRDGQVRSARVRASNGNTYHRPASRLAKLDIGETSSHGPGDVEN